MLKKGKFIKEPPVVIGVQYAKDIRRHRVTPEECFIQDLVLGINPYSTSVLQKVLGRLLQI